MTKTKPQPDLKLAIAQCNATVGDLRGNAQLILDAAIKAYAQGADVLITPELALTGYPPEDLLLRPAFLSACHEAMDALRASLAQLKGLHVVIGHPLAAEGASLRERSVALAPAFNAATVVCEGKVIGTYTKLELPNYQVFDERRYFRSGGEPCVFTVKGMRLGLNICEDAWFPSAPALAKTAGADLLIVINASPFHANKSGEREARMRERVSETGMPLVYAHMVGGQDEVVFDGASFVLNAQGEVVARAPAFEAALLMVDVVNGAPQRTTVAQDYEEEEEIYRALVLGVRDYLGKNGFPGAILGLSGGIDSALTLAIAMDALGKDKVRAVMMPSPYTAEISWVDSRDMAQRCGVQYEEIAIAPMMEQFSQALDPIFFPPSASTSNSSSAGGGERSVPAADTTLENIQARIRGTLLMAISNRTGRIVLTTGNKSELATGYCTLYGDMAGGFAVIKDVAKTMVYRLSAWRNQHNPFNTAAQPIPERIITRAPSAELRPDQTDQDSLPPYEVLDAIMQRYMEDDESIEQIIAAGYAVADVERVTKLLKINEYKRRQAPVGIRITHRAFGRDWRYPITSKFRA
jgi:NAD+ synthase (glutamine-hydrolysing)